MKPKFKVGDIVCWREWGILTNVENSHQNHGLISDIYEVRNSLVINTFNNLHMQ